ncbi:unnamed protein product [Paramecium pentaurelia]|uniref:SKP1-like protein n=1 Tax=Paramecium pentaurelia TaxID=43138 RepID=A0A8S1RYU3_9CILI|nr:unnamed protein product [Paramecium pentaurelia]
MKFISQDGQAFEITEYALKHCTKLSKTNSEIFNLTSTNSNILRKVVQYCEMHQGNDFIPEIKKPLKSNNMFEIVNFIDAQYITNLEFEEIFQIIQVAQILGINTLIDLSCAYISTKIRGKSSEQIKSLFSSNKIKTDEEFQKQRDNENLAKRQLIQTSD